VDSRGGIWFVDLAPVRDPEHVGAAIGGALELHEVPGKPLAESLGDYLRERHVLLLIDNFEQVSSAAPLLGELLAQAPRLHVLATSRAALRLSGEHEYSVPPLRLPNASQLDVRSLLASEAVQLFVTRAKAVSPDFRLTEANARAVVGICEALDGLPLAIELAAARSKLLPPAALLARLERRLDLLTTGGPDLPARQRTLRATIDWSFGLLEEDEQRLIERLAVFVGGFTLEAAEEACRGLSQRETLDAIASLLDKSLLVRGPGAEPRFGMLETIREYALERLAASGQEQAARSRHAGYYAGFMEGGEQLWDEEQSTYLAQVEPEYDNLIAALAWAIDARRGYRPAGPGRSLGLLVGARLPERGKPVAERRPVARERAEGPASTRVRGGGRARVPSRRLRGSPYSLRGGAGAGARGGGWPRDRPNARGARKHRGRRR